MQTWIRSIVAIALIALLSGAAVAEDAYYSVPLKDLKLVDGKIPSPNTTAPAWSSYSGYAYQMRVPSIHLDASNAQAYVVNAENRVPQFIGDEQ